jgi:MFS family permease
MQLNWARRTFLPSGDLARADVWRFLIYSAVFHIGVLGLADVVLNFYFVSLGHDSQVIGYLQSLPRLAGFLTSIPVGLLANRVGAHRMIAWSTIGLICAMLLKVFIPTLPSLALGQFLHGLFYGAQQIALAPLMVALVGPETRTRFFALHNVIAMAAMSLGSFLGGRTPAVMVQLLQGFVPAESTASAQTPFAYGAAIALSALIIIAGLVPFFYLKTDTRGTAEQREQSRTTRIPWLYLLLISLPMLTFGLTGGLTFPFYNLFFRERFGVSDDGVGTILSIGWMGMALVPMLNPWWERRFGRAKSLGLTMTIASVAFAVMGVAPALTVSVVAFTVAISFRNVMQPLYQPLLLDHVPVPLHNLVISVGILLWNIGWFTATIVSGYWQEHYGFGFIMSVVAVGVFITGLTVFVIFHKRPAYEEAAIPTTLQQVGEKI